MRKTLHDELSCGSMNVIDADSWSNKKSVMNPKRLDASTGTFTTIGKTCLIRALLESDQRFFGNYEEETFAESGEDCDMSLSDRENTSLLMDKRTCFSRSVFHLVNIWNYSQDKLKTFYVN